MGKIIEFYGPPACGKTTLSRFTIEYLNNKNFEAMGLKKLKALSFNKMINENHNHSENKIYKSLEPKEIKVIKKLFKILPCSMVEYIFKKSHILNDVLGKELLSQFIFQNLEIFDQIIQDINKIHDENNFRIKNRRLRWMERSFLLIRWLLLKSIVIS